MRTTSRALIFLLLAGALASAATIVLKRAWVDQFKDRATIDGVAFTIDHAHPRPNPPASDGDMHVAGRAPKEIGLPMVAEIMNADNADPAVKLVHSTEGTGKSITVAGAWRLWFEHPPSSGSQIQFNTVPVAKNTNPDHCFEIHPLTKVGPNDVAAGLHDIAGFKPKDATAAFGAYEKLKLSAKADSKKTSVTLTATKTGFNYVLFTMRTDGKIAKLSDGGFAVLADVLADNNDDSDPLAEQVRMIFVPGSPPWDKVNTDGLPVGSELTVLGIPRINLNVVSRLLQGSGGSVTGKKLPYEMIIVALEGSDAASSTTKAKKPKR